MERLYAYCESCPRIEELLKAYLAHASSSSRFLLLTYYTLHLTAVHEHDMYRAFPPAPVQNGTRSTDYSTPPRVPTPARVGTCICPWEGG